MVEAQRAAVPARISAGQEGQSPERTQSQQTRATEQQAQDPQAVTRRDLQAGVERAARNAGGQTPGSMIDMLA
jgi:hypothetical protein